MKVIMGYFQVYRFCPEFLGPAFVSSHFHLRGQGWNFKCWRHILDFLVASKDLLSIIISDFPFPTPMPKEVNSAVISFLKVRLMQMETLSHCLNWMFSSKGAVLPVIKGNDGWFKEGEKGDGCLWNQGTEPHLVRTANFWVFREIKVSYVQAVTSHSAPPILYLWKTLTLKKTILYYKNLFAFFKLFFFLSCFSSLINQVKNKCGHLSQFFTITKILPY